MAHKCNKRQLFAIPASYENNIALAKPEGRGAHARLDSLFSAAIFFLALYHCAAKFFSLFLPFDRVLLSARLLMLSFSSKGKAYVKRLGGKARVKRISSLPGDSPSHSPSTLCLGSDLLSPPHASSLSSALPFSVPLSSSSSFSVSSALDVAGLENHARKPGPMASPFSANPTCPVSRGSPGRRTPFAPPSGEVLLLQPPQASPTLGLSGSGTPPLTSPRPGTGGARKTSATATRPASSNSEARETTIASWPLSSTATVVSPPAGARKASTRPASPLSEAGV